MCRRLRLRWTLCAFLCPMLIWDGVQAGTIILTHELNNFTMTEAIKFYPMLKTAFTHITPVGVALNITSPYLEQEYALPSFAQCTSPSTSLLCSTRDTDPPPHGRHRGHNDDRREHDQRERHCYPHARGGLDAEHHRRRDGRRGGRVGQHHRQCKWLVADDGH